VAQALFQRRSPDKPDKHRPIRKPERVPVGPTEATARCAKRNTAGAAGRCVWNRPLVGQRTGHRSPWSRRLANGEAALASVLNSLAVRLALVDAAEPSAFHRPPRLPGSRSPSAAGRCSLTSTGAHGGAGGAEEIGPRSIW